MSETKHTPGPWCVHADPCHYDTLSSVKNHNLEPIAEVTGDGVAEQEANARLIAAAPELLNELEDSISLLEFLRATHEAHEQIDAQIKATRAVIAKATTTK